MNYDEIELNETQTPRQVFEQLNRDIPSWTEEQKKEAAQEIRDKFLPKRP